jgi:hypothetical protein
MKNLINVNISVPNESVLNIVSKTPYTIENGDLELVYSGSDYKITLEDRL